MMVDHCKHRNIAAKVVEGHPAAYVGTFHITVEHIEAKLRIRDPTQMLTFDGVQEVVLMQVQMGGNIAKLMGPFTNLEHWTLPQGLHSQLGDDHYLDKWSNLFHKKVDDPFATWDAIL
jgi:hypothetical protein